jgi:hypothetical protein
LFTVAAAKVVAQNRRDIVRFLDGPASAAAR